MEVIALKSVLLYYLKHFIASQYEEEADSFIDFLQSRKASSSLDLSVRQNKRLDWYEIPLRKQKNNAGILYTTALPQLIRQDRRLQTDAGNCDLVFQEAMLDFTKKIQVFQLKPPIKDLLCTAKIRSTLSTLWKSFKIESERPGWISFRLSNQGIYTWINQLQSVSHLADSNHTLVIENLMLKNISNDLALRPINKKPQEHARSLSNYLIWQAQYTHARCCSLMRYCQVISTQQALLQKQQKHQSTKTNQTDPLALLESIFCEEQPQPTRQLIQALVETTDDLFWLPERYPNKQTLLLLKRAEQLHIAFDRFHRANPLVPNASQLFPYLTLVSSTRNLLKLLLECYLQVPAPEQLV